MDNRQFRIEPTGKGKGVGVVLRQLGDDEDRTIILDVKSDFSKPTGEGPDHG